jgi:hypothetical protein
VVINSDISLPDGWTWARVEAERAKWDISDNMVPVAVAPGVVAWGTINSVRIAVAASAAALHMGVHPKRWDCTMACIHTQSKQEVDQ